MTSKRRFFSRSSAVFLAAGIAVAGVGIGARVASAQPAEPATPDDVAEYQRLVGEGEVSFNEEKWGEARAKFEQAYSLNPEPKLLFNIASTYRREGQKDDALKYYKKYLEVAAADAQFRRLAEEAVINIEDQIDAERRAAGTPAAKPSGSGKVLRYSGLAVGLVGIGALSFGIKRGLDARELNDKFENLAPGTEWTQELQDEFDKGESYDQQAIIFSIAGGLAIVAGGVLFIAGSLSDAPAERQVSVFPSVGPDSATMVVAGSF